MSRCAHAQSIYKLRKLPKCSKCNIEFILVTAQYENQPDFIYEWECPKCHKAVPKHLLNEEPCHVEEEALIRRNLSEQRRRERELSASRSRKKIKRR